MACYGNSICHTPNLDKLAEQGVLFEKCFTQNPVCSPARASLLTGCLSRKTGVVRNGIPLKNEMPTVADILQDKAYQTTAIGKLHITPQQEGVPEAPFYGFQKLISVEDNSVGPYMDWIVDNHAEFEEYIIGNLFNFPVNEKYWKGRRDLRPEILEAREKYVKPRQVSENCNWGYAQYSPLPEEVHKSAFITDCAIDELKNRKTESPLMMWVGYVDPHNPFDPPERFQKMYSPDDMDARVPIAKDSEHIPPHTKACQKHFSNFSEDDWNKQRALYYGGVTFMDEQIGRLIGAIESELDMSNTIIVYLSDHGENLGDHGICGKQAYHYDGAIRIPLICRWDGKWKPGHRSSEIVEQIDLLPSLLDAALNIKSEEMDGISFASILNGKPHSAPRGYAYAESFNGMPTDPSPVLNTWARTIRSDKWRSTFYPDMSIGELYNLEEDPDEQHNLWAEQSCQGVLNEHRQILLQRLIMMDYPIKRNYDV